MIAAPRVMCARPLGTLVILLLRVAVCCSVLQCVAVCCSMRRKSHRYPQVRMSCVTHMNESYRTMDGSDHDYITHTNKTCYAYERDMPIILTSHVTHMHGRHFVVFSPRRFLCAPSRGIFTLQGVWLDSSICVTWLPHLRDMTHLCV